MPVKHQYACQAVAGDLCRAHNAHMNNVRAIRHERGLSQAQLAELAGLNQATISKLERGDMNVTLDKIHAIARALRVEPAELFTLPDLQRRALAAISAIDPARRDAALVVLEAMARKSD